MRSWPQPGAGGVGGRSDGTLLGLRWGHGSSVDMELSFGVSVYYSVNWVETSPGQLHDKPTIMPGAQEHPKTVPTLQMTVIDSLATP